MSFVMSCQLARRSAPAKVIVRRTKRVSSQKSVVPMVAYRNRKAPHILNSGSFELRPNQIKRIHIAKPVEMAVLAR